MERSVLVRRGAPVAVFALVLAGLAALAARPRGDGGSGRLDPLPLSLGAGSRDERAGAPGAASSDAMLYAPPIVIPDRLLQDLPTEGPAHRVTPGDLSTQRILGLARALGVIGLVRDDGDAWVVGTGDRVLRVHKQPGSPWYLGPDKDVAVARPQEAPATPVPAPDQPSDNPATKPSAEPSTDPAPPVETARDTPCEKECSAPACSPPTAGTDEKPDCYVEPSKPPQPSDEEARATAQRVFDAAGLTDPAIAINDAWSGKEVVGAPVIAGLPTAGFETRVTVELGGRVQYANGYLGGTELKGEYPLLAPREAAERGQAHGGPRAAYDMACPEPATKDGSPAPCPTPEPREAKTLRLGLVLLHSYAAEQDVYLAPAWLLTFAGSVWEEPLLALPDRYVATPPPPSDGGEVPPDQPVSDDGTTSSDGNTSSGSGSGSTGSTGGGEPGSTGSDGTEPATGAPEPTK